jgi:hypothetical protein
VIDQLSDFVKNYVIVYDQVCIFFKKKYLHYFNVKTSSAHEGTNFGIKEHVAAVLPSHKIDAAGKQNSLQALMKGAQMESGSTYMASSQSLWSESPTANYVTNLAKSILSQATTRLHDYSVHRMAIDSWEVHYVGHDNFSLETDRTPSKGTSPIPIFTRIRVVDNPKEFLHCDCGVQEIVGLTCACNGSSGGLFFRLEKSYPSQCCTTLVGFMDGICSQDQYKKHDNRNVCIDGK